VPVTPEDVLLTGRVAIVTGAAVGIGEAIATSFARCGANVAVCDRDVTNLDETVDAIAASGKGAVAAELDVRDRDAVERFVDVVVGEYEHVDVLVNNAGGGFAASFLDVSEKGQRALIDENFGSVTNVVRAVVPHVPETGGSIVNVTSIEAHRAGPGFAIYSAMKAAVANLTKSLALELGARNIRVNCVAPDLIPTPGVGEMPDTRTPLARRGNVDDVAGAALYLASDLAAFVTGTTVHVDGGNWAAGGWRPDGAGGFTTA